MKLYKIWFVFFSFLILEFCQFSQKLHVQFAKTGINDEIAHFSVCLHLRLVRFYCTPLSTALEKSGEWGGEGGGGSFSIEFFCVIAN